MKERHIFKVAILTHDPALYEKLREGIFGVDFDKSYTETRGAAFAYSHFTIGSQRVTAQFWCLDATPQFALVRHLYLKGSSGIIVVLDPKKKKATELTDRLLRELISVNRYPVPMIVLSHKDGSKVSKTSLQYAKELERWSGFEVPHLDMDEKTETTEQALNDFMNTVKDWRAKNVVFQTLKLYFDLDSIGNKSRSIDQIIRQLRQIYTNTYYKLIDDDSLKLLVKKAAENEGFGVDAKNTEVQYVRLQRDTPFD
jgi:GTPase SAR1 family protein